MVTVTLREEAGKGLTPEPRPSCSEKCGLNSRRSGQTPFYKLAPDPYRPVPGKSGLNAQGTVHGAPISVFASSGLGTVPCAEIRRLVTVTVRLHGNSAVIWITFSCKGA